MGVPALKPVDYEPIGFLLAKEADASGRLQPHRDSQAPLELAMRLGRSAGWLGALMGHAMQRGVKSLTWAWLLGTSKWAADLREKIDADFDANERQRRVLNLDDRPVKLTMEERDERAKRILEQLRQEQAMRKAAK